MTDTNIFGASAKQPSTRAVVTEDDVLAFLRDAIRSICTVALLVLMQQDADHAWQTEEIVTTMRANMRVGPDGLAVPGQAAPEQFDGNGMLRRRPASPVLAETVHHVVECTV